MGRVGFGVAAGCAAATCAIAAVLVARRAAARARWRRAVALLREFEEGCATPPGRLRQVVDAMVVEMHAGLASDGGSKLKMLLTFVDALPNGYGPQGPSLLPSTATRFVALRFLFWSGDLQSCCSPAFPLLCFSSDSSSEQNKN
jgi:hexokinase